MGRHCGMEPRWDQTLRVQEAKKTCGWKQLRVDNLTCRPVDRQVQPLIPQRPFHCPSFVQMKDKSTRLYRTADAVRWLLQVAQGLKYLHRAQPQVIHRDLKLDNILLKGGTGHFSYQSFVGMLLWCWACVW